MKMNSSPSVTMIDREIKGVIGKLDSTPSGDQRDDLICQLNDLKRRRLKQRQTKTYGRMLAALGKETDDE